MDWKHECVDRRRCKVIPLRDNGCRSQFRIQNAGEVNIEVVRIDGCEITTGKRCDYLVYVPSSNKVLFIELKGTDVKYGILQIEETFKKYKEILEDHEVLCYVICSQFPRAATGKQVFQKRFKKAHGKTLRIERTPYSERI